MTVSHLMADLRYAIRSFARTPGFTLAAVLSIALGVGANSSIFSVASALLLRPLPYANANRLVILWNRSPGLGIAEDWFSTAQYFDIRTSHSGFADLAIAIGSNYNLTGDGEPERIGTIRMSANLLPMLGVRPAAGRLFSPDDDRPGQPGVAILGHGAWQRRYGGNPAVVGRTLTLNGQPYQVIGVLPSTFDLPREVMPTLGGAEHADVLLPLPLPADAARIRNREDYNLIGRLKPGVSVREAQAEMDGLTARLRTEHPEIYPPTGGLTFSIVPLQEQVVGGVRRSLAILMGAVGFVLLIACANVANLLLSRALGRQREIAVRAAIGASRGRIVGQLLIESVVLATAGGAVGIVLSFWVLEWIQRQGAKSVPRLHEIAIDGRVWLFTLGVSIVAGVLFGLVPALRLGRANLHRHLDDAGRGSSGAGAMWGRGQRTRQLLIVMELALSVVLLVGAGLLIRSFTRVQQVPPGFNPSQTLTLELTMTGRKYGDAAAVLETYTALWTRLSALPGVTATGGITSLPLSQMMAWGPIVVEGRTPPPGQGFINVDQRVAGGNYFAAMGIPLLRGRPFTDADTRGNPRVVLVDAHMARELWPGEDAVGKRIRIGGMDANPNASWMTVVGVVGDIKQDALDAGSRMAMYLPHTQSPSRGLNVVIRSAADPTALAKDVALAIHAIDPDLPLYNVRTMESRVAESLARRRFATSLLTMFALLALGLAALGIYGVIAYVVSQGARELGIRMALGATPGGILLMILRQGMTLAVVGIAAGLAGAAALTRFMRTLLFEVTPFDVATFAAIAMVLGAIALVASLVPARRAARIDPMVSLRAE